MAIAYYNENNPFAAAWLRELIKAGHISLGEVDERSIEDVKPDELRGFTQCHFFAGIGVWAYSLRQAGWPDDQQVWTGSCPCQPFSAAGKRAGTSDERHLWPALYHLIAECRPPVFFGEQVASKDGLAWLDTVSADLEGTGYTFGAVDTCAAGFGAPHIRQRLYFVADSSRQRLNGGWTARQARRGESSDNRELGHTQSPRVCDEGFGSANCTSPRMQDANGKRQWLRSDAGQSNRVTDGFWREADWIACRDGKYRPVESGTFPLAHGSPNRVGRLRGYGNALVAPVATAFIEVFLETE